MKKAFLIIIFFCQISFGDIQATYDNEKTSDEISRNSFGLRYLKQRQNLLWPYEPDLSPGQLTWGAWAQNHQLKYLNSNYSGSDGGLFIGLRPTTKMHLQIDFGAHSLSPGTLGPNITIVKAQAKVDLIFSDRLHTSATLTHDLMYQEMLVGSVLKEGLIADTLATRFQFLPDPNWRLPLRLNYRQISDHNQKSEIDFEAKYGLDQNVNWIWLGAGANQISNKDQKDYWSPKNFLAYGPRLEFAVPVGIRTWKALGELNYNLITEDSTSATGYSIRIGAQWGDRNRELISLSLFEIKTSQTAREWKTQGLNVEAFF